MQSEADIDLTTYLARAPNPSKNKARYEWHMERYRFAMRYMEQKGRIADVGCGWGFGTEYLGRFGGQAYGFDINPQLIDYASSRFAHSDIRFEVHNILNGPLPGSPYDLICMFEVIEHLEEPAKGLANLKASLQRDGVLVLSTPNMAENKLDDHPYHSIQFSHSTLEALLHSMFSSSRFSYSFKHSSQRLEPQKLSAPQQ